MIKRPNELFLAGEALRDKLKLDGSDPEKLRKLEDLLSHQYLDGGNLSKLKRLLGLPI